MNNPETQAQAPTNRHHQWQQHIADWQQSGLSQAAFCQSQQLSYHQFIYWRQKLRPISESANPARTQQLLPVHYSPQAYSTTDLTLTLPNGLRIHGIDSNNLTLVSQLLEQLS